MSATSIVDAGVGRQVLITRRDALRTGKSRCHCGQRRCADVLGPRQRSAGAGAG